MRRTLPVAIAILVFSAGCTGSDDPKAPAGDPTATSTLIDYGDGGVKVARAADASNLTGVPDDFKTFIVAELARKRANKDEACTEEPEIYVDKVDTQGWAQGRDFIPECGGSVTLWAKASDGWKEVWGGQTLSECEVLDRYRFPAVIAGNQCATEDGKFRDYP